MPTRRTVACLLAVRAPQVGHSLQRRWQAQMLAAACRAEPTSCGAGGPHLNLLAHAPGVLAAWCGLLGGNPHGELLCFV